MYISFRPKPNLEGFFLFSKDKVYFSSSVLGLRLKNEDSFRYSITIGSKDCLVTKKMIKKNMVLFDKRNYSDVKDWIFDQFPWIAELFNNATSESNLENLHQEEVERLIETIQTITKYISKFEHFAELHNWLFQGFRFDYSNDFEDPIFGKVAYGEGNQYIARLWKHNFYLDNNLESANFHLWMAFNYIIRDLTCPKRNKKLMSKPDIFDYSLSNLLYKLESFKESISRYVLNIGLQSGSLFLFKYLKASEVLDEMILDCNGFHNSPYQGAFRDITSSVIDPIRTNVKEEFDISLNVNIRGKESIVAAKSSEPFISLLSRIGVLNFINPEGKKEHFGNDIINPFTHHESTEYIQIINGFKTATYSINHSVREEPNPNIRALLLGTVGNIFQDGDGLIHRNDDVDPIEIELTNWNFYQTSKPQSLEEYESIKDEIRKVRMIEDYKRWDQIHGSQTNSITNYCRNDLVEIMTHLQRRGAQESGALSILLAMSMASLLIFVFQESDLLRNLQVMTSFTATLLLLLAFMLLNSTQAALISLQVDATDLAHRYNNWYPLTLYIGVKRAAKIQRRIDICSTFGLCFMALCLFIVPFQYLTEFYQQVSAGLCVILFITYFYWNETVFDTTTHSIENLRESESVHHFSWLIQRWK
jgi:hypothetical protein